MLVHLDGGSNLTLRTLDRVLRTMSARLNNPDRLVFGTRVRPEPREVVHLTAVIRGLRPRSVREALESTAGDDSADVRPLGLPVAFADRPVFSEVELVVDEVDDLARPQRARTDREPRDAAGEEEVSLLGGRVVGVRDDRGDLTARRGPLLDRAAVLAEPDGVGLRHERPKVRRRF